MHFFPFLKGGALKLENKFQLDLVDELEMLFIGCIILKGNSAYRQGVPDLTIFYGSKYAMLECKKSAKAIKQPNQEYYVDLVNDWSFAAFIYPENKEDVLKQLIQFLA